MALYVSVVAVAIAVLIHQLRPEVPNLDFGSLVEALPLVVYVDALDDVSSALYMSPQVEDLLGYPVEQWLEERDLFARILHPHDRERVLRQVRESNAARELFRAEYRLLAKDGRVVWVEDQAVAVGRKEGYAIGYLIDITRRKEAEAARLALVAERASLAAELAREKERGDLLATASHELRTPLATVYGGAQTLLNRSLDEDARERLLCVMVDEADRLRTVIDSILMASSLDAGAFEIAIEPTDIRAVVEDVVASARERLPQHMEIVVDATAWPRACADAPRLRQVLDNLLDNAIKFSGDGKAVRVFVRGVSAGVEITVADDGIGISDAERERLFERFYRARTALEQQIRGTGLGLFIARELVDRMNGQISVESVEGSGSSFTVTLAHVAA